MLARASAQEIANFALFFYFVDLSANNEYYLAMKC